MSNPTQIVGFANTDKLCHGCGKSFTGERGLRSHQSAKFVAMDCQPPPAAERGRPVEVQA